MAGTVVVVVVMGQVVDECSMQMNVCGETVGSVQAGGATS